MTVPFKTKLPHFASLDRYITSLEPVNDETSVEFSGVVKELIIALRYTKSYHPTIEKFIAKMIHEKRLVIVGSESPIIRAVKRLIDLVYLYLFGPVYVVAYYSGETNKIYILFDRAYFGKGLLLSDNNYKALASTFLHECVHYLTWHKNKPLTTKVLPQIYIWFSALFSMFPNNQALGKAYVRGAFRLISENNEIDEVTTVKTFRTELTKVNINDEKMVELFATGFLGTLEVLINGVTSQDVINGLNQLPSPFKFRDLVAAYFNVGYRNINSLPCQEPVFPDETVAVGLDGYVLNNRNRPKYTIGCYNSLLKAMKAYL